MFCGGWGQITRERRGYWQEQIRRISTLRKMRFLLPLLLVVCVLVPLVRSLPALFLDNSELEDGEQEVFEDSDDYYDETPEEVRLFEPNDEPEDVMKFEAVTMDTNLLASEEVW